MSSEFPISPREEIEGIVYFPRMLDKIRRHAAGNLGPDYEEKMGKGFDDHCCEFLGVAYEDIKAIVLDGATDSETLEQCFQRGRTPSPYEVEVWSAYLSKRGWRDQASEVLCKRKEELGLGERDDVLTFFDFIDADEHRSLAQ